MGRQSFSSPLTVFLGTFPYIRKLSESFGNGNSHLTSPPIHIHILKKSREYLSTVREDSEEKISTFVCIMLPSEKNKRTVSMIIRFRFLYKVSTSFRHQVMMNTKNRFIHWRFESKDSRISDCLNFSVATHWIFWPRRRNFNNLQQRRSVVPKSSIELLIQK